MTPLTKEQVRGEGSAFASDPGLAVVTATRLVKLRTEPEHELGSENAEE
jgi:hypothetical protein